MNRIQLARKQWSDFGDISIDNSNCIEQEFLTFDIGTDREDIWVWFESEYDLSVAEDLMYL